jgi:hypothetical protein
MACYAPIKELVAAIAVLAAPGAAWCGPDLGPGPPFPLTRRNWERHGPGDPQLHAVVEDRKTGAPEVAWELRRLAQDEEHVYSSRTGRLPLPEMPQDCVEPLIHLDYPVVHWDGPWDVEPISIAPPASRPRIADTHVHIRPGRDYDRDAFFDSDPRYASATPPPNFRIDQPYANRFPRQPRRLVSFEAGDAPAPLAPECEQARSLRDCMLLSESERAALLEAQWQERRSEHAHAMRCTAVVVAHAGPGSRELSLRVVARDREVWGETTVPVYVGWPKPAFYPLALLSVPADGVILVFQGIYAALWLPVILFP